jgi:hypothetical protein
MKNHHDLSNGHSPLSFSSRENELAVLEQKTKARILYSRAARDRIPALTAAKAKASPAATRHHRVTDLPAALIAVPPIVSSMAPNSASHRRYLRVITSFKVDFSDTNSASFLRSPKEERKPGETRRGGSISLRSEAPYRKSGHDTGYRGTGELKPW